MSNNLSITHFYTLLIVFLLFIIYQLSVNKQLLDKQLSDKQLLDKQLSDKQVIIEKPIEPTIIIKKYLENRDRSILNDPLVAPERRVPYEQYPLQIKNHINIPTRGYPDNYQLLGLLSRENDEKIVQLFGRATFPGSNQYEYYATTEQFGFANKIPIETRGKKEIEDGQTVNIPMLKGEFKVNLYNYDTPRYNPNIF